MNIYMVSLLHRATIYKYLTTITTFSFLFNRSPFLCSSCGRGPAKDNHGVRQGGRRVNYRIFTGCLSCYQTYSVKALKVKALLTTTDGPSMTAGKCLVDSDIKMKCILWSNGIASDKLGSNGSFFHYFQFGRCLGQLYFQTLYHKPPHRTIILQQL